MVGGYQMIYAPFDLAVDEEQRIDGINDELNKALGTDKQVVLYGVKYDDDYITPITVALTPRALGVVVIMWGNYYITVRSNDDVVVEML